MRREEAESWLDDHPDFVWDYFTRKATRQLVDAWLRNQGWRGSASSPASPSRAAPMRKISAHEFDRHLLNPIVSTVEGVPTFLSRSTSELFRPLRKSRQELQALDEKELIFELVKDIFNDLEVRSLCHKILQSVSVLTRADRCSLFLVDGAPGSAGRTLVSQLFDVSRCSRLEELRPKEEIRIPWGTGIVGYVAQTGETVNIPDCYKDVRFNNTVDLQTGYVTRSMLCMPIWDVAGEEVIGVAEVINKNSVGEPFTATDEQVFEKYLQFCGIGLKNARLFERSQLENKRNQVLLDLARAVFEEQSTLETVVLRIMAHTQALLECQRCQVLLVDDSSQESFSRVFDLQPEDMEEAASSRTSPYEGRFPVNIGITGFVAATGQTLNIPDAYEDERFDPIVDEGTGFRHKAILCMPIRNGEHRIIGVSQLVNKLNGRTPFNKNDENLFEAFAIFCGLGLHNTQMYERAVRAVAKHRVTLEVLSYHATAPEEDARALSRCTIPSSHTYHLHDLRFSDFSLESNDMLKACLRMFLDLDLVRRFKIDYQVLCRWVLSVRKNYRQVTYHNWRHAFNVSQMMFAILVNTKLCQVLGELDVLALMVACLCHDLDHRGTNNTFQINAWRCGRSCSHLAQLYSTSTMEHHHFDQSLMILNSQGNQILANLSPEEYSSVVHVLEDAILATDLAVYFRRRGAFFQLVSDMAYDWRNSEHRSLLRAMLMTACDVAAITKPWEIQKVVAELVASEFFQQGDREKEELNMQPIDMMDRDKKDQLPAMQVRFIDAICIPVYEAFAKLEPHLEPLFSGVQSNRAKWQEMSEDDHH